MADGPYADHFQLPCLKRAMIGTVGYAQRNLNVPLASTYLDPALEFQRREQNPELKTQVPWAGTNSAG